MRQRALVAGGGALLLFLTVQLGALLLVEPFRAAGYQSVQNPQDPTNSAVYLAILLVATAGMLLAMRYGAQWLLRGFLLVTSALISWYVFSVVAVPVANALGAPDFALPLSALAAVALGAALLVRPEWYVIDGAGVVMGAGAAALFGISFGVLPAILLLAALAVYDAISVYGTEHMLTLASGVMEMRVPVVLVIPLKRGYSFIEETATGDGSDEGEAAPPTDEEGEREVVFIGLGDAVMPSVLVASAAVFVDAPSLGVPGLALTLPALTAMVGSLLGLLVLIGLVLRGRPHAGLPLLNGGAIAGYLVGALAAGIPLAKALGVAPYL